MIKKKKALWNVSGSWSREPLKGKMGQATLNLCSSCAAGANVDS